MELGVRRGESLYLPCPIHNTDVLEMQVVKHIYEFLDRSSCRDVRCRELKRRFDIVSIACKGLREMTRKLEVLLMHGLELPVPGIVR